MFKTKLEIQKWLDEMEVKNYTINNDLTVDVNDDVKFHSKSLSQLPVQFGVVNGDFAIWNCELESLKGCPHKVMGKFNCAINLLKSLEYCPKQVDGAFIFHNNDITTLEHAPDSVGIFKCYINCLKDLKEFKTQVKDYFEHKCDNKEEQITQFEHLYQYVPHSAFQYLLTLSADQLRAIQQAEDLTMSLPINKVNKKTIKI
jgi:hypothetical protein